MSAPYKASFALAPSNNLILPGSLCNDLLIWTGNSNQNILFGVSNVNTYMSVSGNGNMSLSGNVAFSNQLQLSGIMLTQRTSAFTNNVTSQGATSVQGFSYVNGDVQITMSNIQSNAIRFLQNSTEYMRVSSNGYVGISTSNPIYNLEVNGSIGRSNLDLNFITDNNGYGFGFAAQVAGTRYYHMIIKNNQIFPGNDNNIVLGTSRSRWTAVYAVNGTIQTSDELDKNYVPLTYGLSALMNVSTIKYKWKSQDDLSEDDPKKNYEYFGICARELNELFPELVYNEQEPYQVNYSEIIPVCINAIKELKKEKDDEISILRQEIENMKIDIAALRKI